MLFFIFDAIRVARKTKLTIGHSNQLERDFEYAQSREIDSAESVLEKSFR